jgi:predicted  nucleic acid-binding Zn-ribbon protein
MADAAAADTEYDLTIALREKLRTAIDRRDSERKKLTALEAGKSRVHDQLREVERRKRDAEDALHDAKNRESSWLARAYLYDNTLTDDPVAAQQANVNTLAAEAAKLDKISRAISGEIDQLQSTVRNAMHDVYRSMSAVVVASDEFQLLIESHRAAWKQLRTIKTAIRAVSSGLNGYCPQNFSDEAIRSEPLEPRRGYDIDEDLVGSWSAALADLEQNSDAEFPLFA